MATSMPVEDSIAVYTVPEAPWPIFSILVYFRFGSPTETMVRSFSKISSSDIFFFLALAALVLGVAAGATAAWGTAIWFPAT